MYKIILVFGLSLAAVKAEHARNEDYITLNKFHYQQIVKDYDTKLAFFEKHYNGRVGAAVVHSELISNALVENENRLHPFLLLGNLFKSCVAKYKLLLPSVLETKQTIASCELGATKQLSDLMSAARLTRDVLYKFVNEKYDQDLNDCAEQNELATSSYTLCITTMTSLANTFVIKNKKNFEKQLEAADCTSKAHIDALLDCTFIEQTRAISLISEVNVLIKKCLDGVDECRSCQEYTCSESYELDVNNTSETIRNPFFGRDNHNGCLMLNAKHH